MVNWNNIDTVLLDLDGTLLDLNFDNYFWLTYVPYCYACKNDLDLEDARRHIFLRYRAAEGTLNWYCVDYWSDLLGLNIVALKHRVSHKIRLRPNAVEFLKILQSDGFDLRLVTNAHQKTLAIKLPCTGLKDYFDVIISAHIVGVPKESPKFWPEVLTRHPFDPRRALFIDDSVPVLRNARRYGIRTVLGVFQPDSGLPGNTDGEFDRIGSFTEIMPHHSAGRC